MNLRHGSIYAVTNKYTGEQYVGQTRKSVQKRWDSHWRTATCSKAQKAKFQTSLLTAGKNAFIVEELFVAFDEVSLNNAEISIILDLKPSYNSTRGGKGLRSITITEETKTKRSLDAKARWANLEWREKTLAAMKLAAKSPEAIQRGKNLQRYEGSKIRWAGHVKKEQLVCDRAIAMKKTWLDPNVRQKRVAGLKAAFAKPEVKARLIVAQTGRIKSRESVEKTARAKWKPLYCPEIQTTFLCGKYAAEYFQTLRTSVCNAVKQKGKLLRKYSLEKVS